MCPRVIRSIPTTGAAGGPVEEHSVKEVTRSGASSGDNSPLKLNQICGADLGSCEEQEKYSRIG